jgi:hypothetical protein
MSHYVWFPKFNHRFTILSLTLTGAHTRFMLLHDSRSEDGIKSFFQEVHEIYIKVRQMPLINNQETSSPLYSRNTHELCSNFNSLFGCMVIYVQ